MTCHEMDGVISLRSGTSGFPPEAAKHVAGCERCRRLVRVLDQRPEGLTPSPGRLKQIQTAMVEDLRPVRPLAPARVFLFAFVIVFLTVVAVGYLRIGADGWGALRASQKIVVFATLATAAALLAVSMVRQMVPGSKHTVSPTLLPVGILVLLMIVMAVSDGSSLAVLAALDCDTDVVSYEMTQLVEAVGHYLTPALRAQ